MATKETNEIAHPRRILTNMSFWQSPTWLARTESIYDLTDGADPEPRGWWSVAWELFRRRRAYDLVVTEGVRESFAYAWLCRWSRKNPIHIMTEVFIDPPGRQGWLWKTKNRFYRRLATRAAGIITNSAAEVDTIAERYAYPREKLVFVPLNTNIADPHLVASHNGTILSAGRTQRDYALLLKAAREVPAKITIICGKDDIPDANPPPNVTIIREIDRDTYLDHLRNAMIVCLPLQRTPRSTGQVVVLEAMAYGKPVVATRAPGTIDYLVDHVNGRLVPPDDATALASVLRELIEQPGQRDRLGRQALHDILDRYLFEHHAELKLAAFERLCSNA